jgi:nicotinate-nucleotide adenylyltransferase
MKVCLFGGTFDPPHIGHLLIAQTIIESENFDQFFFIPANITPNKVKKLNTDSLIRNEMLELAIKDNPNFKISDFEIQK